ncbi:eukaryotic translation initiation factor 3 subunit E [Linnemannia schmuckeri]|uniref:Eukaryotic translation initiation factor 3 subunit E n=1 Tax=Linnemannia schmuckeri TaxID=64567 RepID=A0A9P5VD75_9FUNG|nr:eukaryotic translation initiation factor 3 subunit E [Linnemannia schmuckeri]
MSAQYDLTSKMIPFLDFHLVFPLLEFLEINKIARNRITFSFSITHPRQLALKTSLVDFIDKVHGELTDAGVIPTVTIESTKKQEEILEQLQKSNAEAQKVTEAIENRDVTRALRQNKL